VRYIIAVILLSSSVARASDVIPPIEDMPIFRTNNAHYSDAAVAFQKALFIQLGVARNFNMVRAWANSKADGIAGTATTAVQRLPAGSAAIGVAAVAYSVVVRKQVVRQFVNPMFINLHHDVTLGLDNIRFGVSVAF
jgi:hypothetical protein